MSKNKAEFDGSWKDILDIYFEQFIAFCWPSKYQEIDWTKGYKMLDKELTKITRKSKTGKRLVDKLVEIHLKSGDIACILLHIEVEKAPKANLPSRIFTYNTRLRDYCKRPIASLVILLDGNKNRRPNIFKEELWGTSIEMHFPIIKILDFQDRIPELEASSNPFAEVILAQLAVIKKESPFAKLQTKTYLTRRLYKKGWKKDDLLALLEFIDWIIALPPELELQYTEIVEKIEEESNMAYVTSFERVGMQKGMQKGMEQGMQQGMQQGKEIGVQEGKVLGECEFLVNLLTTKFQIIPKNYLEKITQANGDTLMTWGRKLLFAPTIECVFEEKDA